MNIAPYLSRYSRNEAFYIFFISSRGVAFFTPCAVALLPAYIVAFISQNTEYNDSSSYLLLRGLKLAFFSILGILVFYGCASILILVASQILKDYLKWIALFMGIILIILGILILLGKNILLNLHMKQKEHNNEVSEAFYFGLAYGIGALGCLFPLFLIVTTEAVSEPNLLKGISYILAYFTGISSLMILTIVLAIFAKNFMSKQLRTILPYMQKGSGLLLILAGIYIVQYPLILF